MSDAAQKNKSRLVNFKATHGLINAIHHGARRLDLDKSKFIRAAIREKLQRHGVSGSAN